MDLTWNLDTLYPSFGSGKLQRDREQLHSSVVRLSEWKTRLGPSSVAAVTETATEFLQLYHEYKSVNVCLSAYAELILSVDYNHEEALSLQDHVDEAAAEANEAYVVFGKWLSAQDSLDTVIGGSPYLEAHRFFLQDQLRQAAYLLSEEVERTIAKLQGSGAKAWQRLFMTRLAGLSGELAQGGDGAGPRQLPIAELQQLAYDRDASSRQAAYEAEKAAYAGMALEAAACLNGISGEAVAICEMRGYRSPLDKVLAQSWMDHATLDTMFAAIREKLPALRRYFRTKAELLGHAGPLPFYEMFAPVGEGAEGIPYEQAQQLIQAAFHTFSPRLAAFAGNAFEQRWIDAEPREGKGNYGLCVDIFPLQESRIMMSYHGRSVDIGILAHELGHAFHCSCLAGESLHNTGYPVPIAETASIFCETLVNGELLRTAVPGEAASILEKCISDAAYYLVDFYGRFLFEQRLYERRQAGALSVDELNELMLACMTEAYGDSVDPATLHPYMWMNKIGYFVPGREYLNFPYSFGFLFAKGLYARYQRGGPDFPEHYEAFLAATGKNSIADTAQLIGIDVHSAAFWSEALGLIEADIRKWADMPVQQNPYR